MTKIYVLVILTLLLISTTQGRATKSRARGLRPFERPFQGTGCVDREDRSNVDCSQVKSSGKCADSDRYSFYCAKTCGYCGSDCQDKDYDCSRFEEYGDYENCADDPEDAYENCRRSCGYCED
uniref:Toxin candidate TRINITY_DN38738_c1_g2_i2 n=1 Tax=Pachycerianthus maua TaxID=2736681 RepID=A0A7G7WYZ3_9CNID|nr:toxin candidate TRINITY_DN38738_c1_g2_i2 [Pachycerianthus maua]